MDDTSRPYQLLFEERPGYLHVQVYLKTMTVEITREYLTEIAEKCTELNCKRLLFECDVPGIMPAGSVFEVTTHFLSLMSGRRVAIVDPRTGITEALEFGVLIANNRGALFQLFNNTADAEAWLLT